MNEEPITTTKNVPRLKLSFFFEAVQHFSLEIVFFTLIPITRDVSVRQDGGKFIP